ncbi:MAG: hypothetical protein V2A58_04140 [Planctomycetota bacterium]
MSRRPTTAARVELRPASEWRVIHNDDATNNLGGLTTAEIIRERIDFLAKVGVDALAWCTCSPDLCNYPTQAGEWRAAAKRPAKRGSGQSWNWAYNMRKLVEEGNDPVDVMAARCHEHGMPFLGSIRMNDIHHIHAYRHVENVTQFVLEHGEWCIRDGSGKVVGGMDYAVEGVRAHRLAILQEQFERYEMDGLDLDFMRTPPFFQPGRERAGAAIMTEYVRSVREMLDETAKRKGRGRPILGARVPTTLGACEAAGIELSKWIGDRLLDYACPSHGSKPDANIPVEEFVKIAKGKGCGIFPTVQSNVAAQYDREVVQRLPHYRGLANNYFRFGAQGISTFNFMIGGIGTWHVKRHQGKWDMLREIHEPEEVGKRERRYSYDHQISPERFLTFDRTKDTGKRKAIPFRVAEDFSDRSWRRWMRFKPNDLSVGDKIEIDVNGVSVTERLVSDFVFFMCDPPNSGRFCFDLEGTAARTGDNELGVTLVAANPELEEWTPDYLGYAETLPVNPIFFTEIEIVVRRR